MRREAVDSEALRSVGYDPAKRILEIEFSGGTIYRYFGVPASLHAGLMTAESKGEYYSANIRMAGFEYERQR